MSSLLPFKIFCQRKRFSIERYIKNLPNATFTDFYNFLVARGIQPPKKEEFIKVKDSLKIIKISVQELDNVEESNQVEAKEEVVIQKPKTPVKRRRRRTKKKVDNND